MKKKARKYRENKKFENQLSLFALNSNINANEEMKFDELEKENQKGDGGSEHFEMQNFQEKIAEENNNINIGLREGGIGDEEKESLERMNTLEEGLIFVPSSQKFTTMNKEKR